jgi:hypothetical protein
LEINAELGDVIAEIRDRAKRRDANDGNMAHRCVDCVESAILDKGKSSARVFLRLPL